MDENIHDRSSIVKSETGPSSDAIVAQSNADTLRLAFEEAGKVSGTYGEWVSAIDTKLMAVFGISSVIASIAPVLNWGAQLTGAPRVAWVAALVAWAVSAGLCIRGYWTRGLRFGIMPQRLHQPDWLSLTPDEYRYYRLEDMGKTDVTNREQIMAKGKWLALAMIGVIVEVVALFATVLLRAFG